jgi:hypothetical protein
VLPGHGCLAKSFYSAREKVLPGVQADAVRIHLLSTESSQQESPSTASQSQYPSVRRVLPATYTGRQPQAVHDLIWLRAATVNGRTAMVYSWDLKYLKE